MGLFFGISSISPHMRFQSEKDLASVFGHLPIFLKNAQKSAPRVENACRKKIPALGLRKLRLHLRSLFQLFRLPAPIFELVCL